MVKVCKQIAESSGFQRFILFTLLVTAVAIGLETVPELEAEFSDLFYFIYLATQTIFCLEMFVRVVSYYPSPGRFFKGFWNIFDFTITALSLLPIGFGFVAVARLLRLIRVLRVFSASKRLQLFLSKMQSSLDELILTAVILLVLAYIFGISGHYLFSEIAPQHWGSLPRSLISVFYLVLLQNISAIMEPLIASSALNFIYFAALYFTFFSLFACAVGAISSEYTASKRGAND